MTSLIQRSAGWWQHDPHYIWTNMDKLVITVGYFHENYCPLSLSDNNEACPLQIYAFSMDFKTDKAVSLFGAVAQRNM